MDWRSKGETWAAMVDQLKKKKAHVLEVYKADALEPPVAESSPAQPCVRDMIIAAHEWLVALPSS